MSRKRLTAIAVGAGLAAGSFTGLALNLPGVASAQDDDTQTQQESGTHPGGHHGHEPGAEGHRHGAGRHAGRGGPGLEAAAAAIGIPADDLRTQLRSGQSIAAVAEANGVDVNVVIDAMTAEARTRITDMVNRVPGEHMNGERRGAGPQGGGHMGPGHRGGGHDNAAPDDTDD
jgi:hypothetical protein